MSELRRVTTRRGRWVDSPHSDEAAVQLLVELVTIGIVTSGFAKSLAAKASGPRGRLTAEQTAWCHVIVVDAEAAARREAESKPVLASLVALIQRGLDAGLRKPTVRALWKGYRIQVHHADGGSFAGQLVVSDGAKFPDRKLFGTIVDCRLKPARLCPEWVPAALEAVADDPEGMAQAYGQLTETCCFCARELTTGESCAVGYGPDCAEKYGLPWGQRRVNTKADLFELKDGSES